MYLYHYYDKSIGPFISLSDLPIDEAVEILRDIKTSKPTSQSAQRQEKITADEYVRRRHNCESILRNKFIKIGGVMKRKSPHYMVVEHSPWLSTWFENSAFIKISIEEFDLDTVSFTYGDCMPTFGLSTDKEYSQKIYRYNEIIKIIDKYGLPQHWNDDGKHGYERYIEACVWSDDPIKKYL